VEVASEVMPKELLHYGAQKGGAGANQDRISTSEVLSLAKLLRERSIPDLLWRSENPISTAPERELSFANAVGELDARQCNGRTSEGFEASH
jgi:hypothetical protein